MVHNDLNNEIATGIRRAVAGEWVRPGFDANQALGRFDKMVERIHRDAKPVSGGGNGMQSTWLL